MPLLTMDKHGNIVETDSRFDGVQGVSRRPELVDHEDMTELSLVPDDKVLKDKKALRKLQAMRRINQINQYKQNVAKQAVLEKRRKKQEELNYQKRKQEKYKAQLTQNMAFLKARQEGGAIEKMSGVTGFGFSADGRRPVLSQATMDWNPILQTNTAFGGDVEDWGHDINFGQDDTAVVKDNITPEKDLGSLTTRDQLMLEQWEAGSYGTPVYIKGNPVKNHTQVWEDQYKQELVDVNKELNHPSNMTKYAQQGWGYSLLHNADGSVDVVKVSFHWGIPMFTPNNAYSPLYTKDYVANSPWLKWEPQKYVNAPVAHNNPEAFIDPTVFTILYPVIKAAAREYQYKSGTYSNNQNSGPSQLDQALQNAQSTNPNVTTASVNQPTGSGEGFFRRTFPNNDPQYFAHPFLKQNLLKKKG